jgi:hypothetical protein
MMIISEANTTFYPVGSVVELSLEMRTREGLETTYAKVETTAGGCSDCILLPIGDCDSYFTCLPNRRVDNTNVWLAAMEKPE